jgi:hypothetical protein
MGSGRQQAWPNPLWRFNPPKRFSIQACSGLYQCLHFAYEGRQLVGYIPACLGELSILHGYR